MTVADLIAKLKELPGDMVVTAPMMNDNVEVADMWVASSYGDMEGNLVHQKCVVIS